MKILHTSDWHLGHRLHEHLQQYEQEKFLKWLIDLINDQNIDVLLVAGDIFDTAYPSTQSQEMFYRFLAEIHRKTNCQEVVMTAGNHDAPGTINAPDNFVRYFNIKLVGKASENVQDEIFGFDIGGEKLIVAAVPFLRDRDIRRAIAGENALDIENRYKKALINHYNDVANIIENQNKDNAFIIAMGHLFAIGGQPSDSENRIYVGGLGDIKASDFPAIFDYVALGHLHRPQKVDKKEHIRYSGSPYPLSFSEIANTKKVIIIETKENKLHSVDEVKIPRFRQLYTIKGTLEYCKNALKEKAAKPGEPTPFAEVIIDQQDVVSTAYAEINEVVHNKNIKVLKVRVLNKNNVLGIEQLIEEDKKLNELRPEDIFKKKCNERDFDLTKNKEILDAFNEILSMVNEN